jgi:hypothetical protein
MCHLKRILGITESCLLHYRHKNQEIGQQSSLNRAHSTVYSVSSPLVQKKFGICTIVGLSGTLVDDKMRTFKGECEHFSFNKSPI